MTDTAWAVIGVGAVILAALIIMERGIHRHLSEIREMLDRRNSN